VSPAFIRELLRKAALLAVLPTGGSGDRDGVTDTIIVTDQQLDQAMHELVLDGGELTGRLLGAASRPAVGSAPQAAADPTPTGVPDDS
jgi:hypothetical protein